MLRAHADGAQRLGALLERIDWAAEATLRGSIATLRQAMALEKRPAKGARNAVATVLTEAGEEMLAVSQALERWLGQCPNGPVSISDERVKVVVKALAGGWSSALMRELAVTPRSLTELSSLIPGVSYPSLERRIGWMRSSGQIAALPKEARGTPYAPTDWLRGAVAPLCVAGRCERRHMPDPPPITDVEIEAAFLLSLPLVQFPRTAHGRCLLASHTDGPRTGGRYPGLAGVTVGAIVGELASVEVSTAPEPATWAIGRSDAWLDAVIDGRVENLRIGGINPQLAVNLVQGLHNAFFINR